MTIFCKNLSVIHILFAVIYETMTGCNVFPFSDILNIYYYICTFMEGYYLGYQQGHG